MSSIRYEFIMSQVKMIRDITETEKVKISLVFYEGSQMPCVFKICKNRDLLDVYQTLMKVRHPNLAIIYDCVYENGNTYVVEEYIQGKTIADILTVEGTFTEHETIRIMKEVCEGLEVLHQQEPSLIHNDIKASNIMIREDGSVKLFDFDISRIYKDGSSKNTRLMGTHEYAAPEHYGFGQSEPCTDIYSLGVTMHEMLTGAGLDHEHQVTYKGRLTDIIRKCVEIDRKKRYASAMLLKADLEKLQKKAHPTKFFAFGAMCAVVLLVMGVSFFSGAIGAGKETSEVPQTEVWLSETLSEEGAGTEVVLETEKIESSEENKDSEEVESVPPTTPEKPATSESEDGASNVTPSGMKIVYPIQGTFLAMETWNDGTYVYMEEQSGVYYLKSSVGKETQLQGVRVAYGAQLERNPYTDQMYLLLFDYEEQFVYTVTRDLEIELVTKYSVKSMSNAFVAFYSDGTMVYDSSLLNSSDWSYIGPKFLGASPYIIKDEVYSFESSMIGTGREFVFMKRDEHGNLVKVFPLKEEGIMFLDYQNPRAVYGDSKDVYFIGVKDGKNYVYRFNGEKYEALKCLNDDPNFVPFGYEELCVTADKVRCYSYPHRAIVEFTIE